MAFERVGNQLKVTITDNGIGRDQAKTISSQRLKEHRSAGMGITEKRIQLHNGSGQQQLLTITDLFDSMGKPAGTQVSFYLPIKEY